MACLMEGVGYPIGSIDASLPIKDIFHISVLGENGCNSIIYVVSMFDLCRPEN